MYKLDKEYGMKKQLLSLICLVILMACGGSSVSPTAPLSALEEALNSISSGSGPSFTDAAATQADIDELAKNVLTQFLMVCFGSAEEVNNTFDYSTVAPGSNFNFSVSALSIPGTISGDVKIDAQVQGTMVNVGEGSESMALQILHTNFSLISGLTMDGNTDCDYSLQVNSAQEVTFIHPVGAVAFSGTYGGKTSVDFSYNIIDPVAGDSTGNASGEILLVSGTDTYSCPFAFDSSTPSTDVICNKI